MSWYKDSAKDSIDAKLALVGAGAMGNVATSLAKIPLDIGNNKLEQRAMRIKEDANLVRKYVADRQLQGKQVAASGKVAAAQLGLQGKQAMAFAKQYATDGRVAAAKLGLQGKQAAAYAKTYEADIKERNNIRTTSTNKANKTKDVLIATIKKQVKPTESVYYDDKGVVTKKVVKKPYKKPIDFSLDDLDKIAKSVKGAK